MSRQVRLPHVMVISLVYRICIESHEDLHVLDIFRNDEFGNRFIRISVYTFLERIVTDVLDQRS